MAEYGEINRAQMPLLGVILCCTSIAPEKRVRDHYSGPRALRPFDLDADQGGGNKQMELAETATQMGGIHKFDLTSDVTHLIVGETDTPKYRFVAKERPDVKCLLPTWIDAVRDSWVTGGATNVDQLEDEHRLPTFQGLRICVTGFEDLAYRKDLEELINGNGGEYRGNLTKDVTHLVARVPSGTKYTYAGEWGSKIVSVEWLMQSLERGMILDEKLYNLLLPEAERGQNAWIHKTASITSLGKRAHDEVAAPKRSRKLRRTASAKLNSQNVGLWTDIVSGGTEVEEKRVAEWDDKERDDGHGGMLKTPKAEPDSEVLGVREFMNPTDSNQIKPQAVEVLDTARVGRMEGLFQGQRFFLHGFKERQNLILRDHLRSHQAEILNDIGELSVTSVAKVPESGYVIVPHTIKMHDIPAVSQRTKHTVIVTDMWIERCLHCQKLVQPQANLTNTPFRCFPIAGFEQLIISSTAFQGVDLLHMSKSAKLMGAAYSEFFTSNTSVLVCNTRSPNSEKLSHANRWNVPAVTADWLWDCIREAKLKAFDQYLVQAFSHELIEEDPFRLEKPLSNDRKINNVKKPLILSSKPPKACLTGQKLETKEDFLNSSVKAGLAVAKNSSLVEGVLTKQHGETVIHPQSDELSKSASGKPDNNLQLTLQEAAPLQEISSNPSLKPPSPGKVPSPPPPKPVPLPNYKEEDSLGPAISSLLAHHQRPPTNSPVKPVPTYGRRRRHLFGRAPSNISMHSNGSISISRASSVDTMNTDGLGTPLESYNSAAKNETTDAFATLRSYEKLDGGGQAEDNHLMMTQLGYEDPDVQAWRERVVKKMGGATGIEIGNADSADRRTTDIGVVKDVAGKGIQAVSKRTRQALGKS